MQKQYLRSCEKNMDTKYNIIFTEKAEKDLKEIYKYIFENLKEPNIAMKLMEEIEQKY